MEIAIQIFATGEMSHRMMCSNMHVNLCQGCKYENVARLALQAKVMQNLHECLNVEKQLHP